MQCAPGCRKSPHLSDSHSHIWRGWGWGLVCSWAGGAGGCRGRLHLPTRDVLSRRHNNWLARDKGAGPGRRAGPGGRGEARARRGWEPGRRPPARPPDSVQPLTLGPPRPPCRPRPGNRCPGLNSLLSAPRTERSAAPGRAAGRHGGVLEELAGQRRG